MTKFPSRLILRILSVAVVIFLLLWAVYYFVTRMYPIQYEEQVLKYSREYGVEPDLIFAVIKTESGFDPNAVSQRGAIGLMQITPDTYRWASMRMGEDKKSVNEESLLDPEVNIRFGVYILSLHLKEFKNTDTALCAYNAGRGTVNG